MDGNFNENYLWVIKDYVVASMYYSFINVDLDVGILSKKGFSNPQRQGQRLLKIYPYGETAYDNYLNSCEFPNNKTFTKHRIPSFRYLQKQAHASPAPPLFNYTFLGPQTSQRSLEVMLRIQKYASLESPSNNISGDKEAQIIKHIF